MSKPQPADVLEEALHELFLGGHVETAAAMDEWDDLAELLVECLRVTGCLSGVDGKSDFKPRRKPLRSKS